MAGIIFSKSSGLQDSIYGKSEAPIKAFLEDAVKVYEENSFVSNIYKEIESSNYAEKFSGMTSFAQGFIPTPEGGAYPEDERQEGYSKTLEHVTWKNKFVVTEEMIEDQKIFDINRTGARGFIDSFNLTKENFGSQLLVGAITATTVSFRGKSFDCTSADGVAIFSTAHTSKTGNASTQSNKYSNVLSADALGLGETAMQNYTDDNGNILTVSPDTIIIPNSAALKKTLFAAIGADKDPATANNGFNYHFGRWTVIVNPYMNSIASLGYWFMYDSNYNEAYNGLLWLNRVPLTIKTYIDENNDNNVWKGRSRFIAGCNDWRSIAVFGVSGGTTLS